jgi:hypothetical protein
MPVEIRELVIRAVVSEAKPAVTASKHSNISVDKDDIIKECVKQVLQILKKQGER